MKIRLADIGENVAVKVTGPVGGNVGLQSRKGPLQPPPLHPEKNEPLPLVVRACNVTLPSVRNEHVDAAIERADGRRHRPRAAAGLHDRVAIKAGRGCREGDRAATSRHGDTGTSRAEAARLEGDHDRALSTRPQRPRASVAEDQLRRIAVGHRGSAARGTARVHDRPRLGRAGDVDLDATEVEALRCRQGWWRGWRAAGAHTADAHRRSARSRAAHCPCRQPRCPRCLRPQLPSRRPCPCRPLRRSPCLPRQSRPYSSRLRPGRRPQHRQLPCRRAPSRPPPCRPRPLARRRLRAPLPANHRDPTRRQAGRPHPRHRGRALVCRRATRR